MRYLTITLLTIITMNKILIGEASDSDRRLMSGLLTRAGYEPIVAEDMEAAKTNGLPPKSIIMPTDSLFLPVPFSRAEI